MAEWNQCFYCGQHLGRRSRTYDHYVPESYGGDTFVVACKKCNNLKGDSTVDDFRNGWELKSSTESFKVGSRGEATSGEVGHWQAHPFRKRTYRKVLGVRLSLSPPSLEACQRWIIVPPC